MNTSLSGHIIKNQATKAKDGAKHYKKKLNTKARKTNIYQAGQALAYPFEGLSYI